MRSKNQAEETNEGGDSKKRYYVRMCCYFLCSHHIWRVWINGGLRGVSIIIGGYSKGAGAIAKTSLE